jgi:hypothetical protein
VPQAKIGIESRQKKQDPEKDQEQAAKYRTALPFAVAHARLTSRYDPLSKPATVR